MRKIVPSPAASVIRSVTRVIAAVTVAGGVVTFAVAAWCRNGRPGQVAWIDVGVYAAVYLGAATLALTHRSADRRLRHGWRWLGAAMTTQVVANVLFSLIAARSPDTPSPSVADVFYLAWYPCSYLGLLQLIRAGAGRARVAQTLDGVIAGLGAAAVAIAVVYGGLLNLDGASSAEVLVNLAYPLGDLVLLLLLVAGGVIVGGRTTRCGVLLATGLLVTTGADLVYLLQDAAGSYVEGGWADLLWLIGVAAMAAAETVDGGRPATPTRSPTAEGMLTVAPQLVFALTSITVIAAQQAGRAPWQAVIPADTAVLAALGRAILRWRELQHLKAHEVAELQRLARTDDLTGLPNRRGLHQAHQELTHAPGSPTACLLLVGINSFRRINNSLGHVVGDDLLRQVAQRLDTATPSGCLARISGDEFAVLAPGTQAQGQRLAEHIRSTLTRPFLLGAVQLHIDVRIGLTDTTTGDLDELLRRAGLAMSHATQLPHSIRVFEPHDDNVRHHLRLTEQLRAALRGEAPERNGRLIVHVQPQIRLTHSPATVHPVVGAEALVRWQHPDDGLLLPGLFLPLAATAGLLPYVADTVLDAALHACRTWHDTGHALPVSVNLAASDLLDPNLPQRISTALDRHHLPPTALTVELTEDGLLADPTLARAVLTTLRTMGTGISVDDYGTGYSSLAYLQDLPLDELKLDQVFTRRLAEEPPSPRAAAIVRTTTDLAHSLGLRLVAEGIENDTAVARLTRLGVDIGQGHHIARPMPPDRFITWLAAHQPARSALR